MSQWLKKAREKGPEALKANPAPGPAARLSEDQKVKLGQLLEAGAENYGFQGEVWTHERVAWLIKKHFAVQYRGVFNKRATRGNSEIKEYT